MYNIKPWLATPSDSANRLPSINWIVQYSRSIDVVFYYTDSVVCVVSQIILYMVVSPLEVQPPVNGGDATGVDTQTVSLKIVETKL